MTESTRRPPAYDELPVRDGARCAWGVWGTHDTLGCLNLLSPPRVSAGSSEIRRGDVFSLNWSLALPDPPLFERARWRHEIRATPGTRSQDEQLHEWNTQASTQWDGFRHVRREGHGHFGGIPDREHGVDHWAKKGIVGRAVLADVARWRASVDRPIRHGTADAIEPEDVIATLDAQGSRIQDGDILLLRTGWIAWYLELSDATRAEISKMDTLFSPGLRASEESARMLWNLHVAAVAADNPALEVWPIGAHLDPAEVEAIAADPVREHEMLLHTHLLPMLGLPIGELFDLEALAADSARDGRYTSFFTSAPLNLPGAVASPPNALAIK